MGGSVEKQIQKALGSLPPCGNRCRFSESAICSSRVHPPSEIKSNFKFKALIRWHPLRWRSTLFVVIACPRENGREVSNILLAPSDSSCHCLPSARIADILSCALADWAGANQTRRLFNTWAEAEFQKVITNIDANRAFQSCISFLKERECVETLAASYLV